MNAADLRAEAIQELRADIERRKDFWMRRRFEEERFQAELIHNLLTLALERLEAHPNFQQGMALLRLKAGFAEKTVVDGYTRQEDL